MTRILETVATVTQLIGPDPRKPQLAVMKRTPPHLSGLGAMQRRLQGTAGHSERGPSVSFYYIPCSLVLFFFVFKL